jgi:uncharacterized protein
MSDNQEFLWLHAYAIRRAMALFYIVGTLLCVGAPATAASFNCEKAKTNIEKLICADGELGELDAALAKVYGKARISSGDSDAVDAVERDWLKTVRDKCSSVDCLKSAYHARIKQLARNFVSFDCERAKTKIELLICGDDRLQYADMQLAQAYRTLKGASNQQEKLIADQKRWLEQVRDKCDETNCLLSTIKQRTDVLRQQWSDLIESTSKKIGYAKHAFYSDMMIWPNDASRTILIFATQASATQDTDSGPKQDEDFDVDLYVIDSASHKILQHGTDSIASDAIELTGLGLDRTDYAARLSAPVFGITTSLHHYGCAGYSKNSLHLYAASGKGVKGILPEIATNMSAGMCQTDCEYRSSWRDLQFTGPAGQRFPDLLIRERHKEAEDDPKGPKGACKTTYSRKEYKLHFDGVQYPVPQGLDY